MCVSLFLSLYQSDQIMATNCQTSPLTTNNVSEPCAPRMARERMKEKGEGDKKQKCVCVREREEDEGLGGPSGLVESGVTPF